MDDETVEQLRAMLAAHANVVRTEVTLNKMKVANDEARSRGEDDAYDASAFEALENEVQGYAEELAG